jgi:hypothetical protein
MQIQRNAVQIAAIPGKGKTPVITTLSPLAFRKHQCDNTPLTGTLGWCDEGCAMALVVPKERKHLSADALFRLV